MKEQHEIYVNGSDMRVVYKKDEINCVRKSRRFTPFSKSEQKEECSMTKKHHERKCISPENNKFRIAQFDDGGIVYVCMSFTLRSNNVIQVTQGAWRSTNAPDLCENMYVDDWPWIASWNPEPTVCPVAGGFTFRTKSRLTNQDVCKDDWRRSKLEIECLKGDGMDFFAPKGSNCNPFLSQGEWKRLYCLGGWTYGNHSFMIAAGDDNNHHFCIRFPAKPYKEFVALLYFSPICPIHEDGQPSTGIDYYELHLNRTDRDECEDENEKFCQNHAQKGMCEKSNNRYLPHCRKTCGLCNNKEHFWTEVSFSELVRGKWLLFEKNKEERVVINRTHIYFSNLGHFVCLERVSLPAQYLYKLVSNFNNGCSEIIELKRPHNNILQFRLGRSFREDKNHIEMCNFKKDTYSDRIESRYRSPQRRNLLREGELWESPCGLSGTIPFEAVLGGHKCTGNVSDWNAITCTYNTHVQITSNNCIGVKTESKYKCLAFLNDEFDLSEKMSTQVILTQAMDGSNEFICWVLTTFPGDDFEYPETRIYKMPNLQCSSFEYVNQHLIKNKNNYFHLLYDKKSKATVCEPAINPTLSRPQNDENITYRVIEQPVPSSKTIKITAKPPISSRSNRTASTNAKYHSFPESNCNQFEQHGNATDLCSCVADTRLLLNDPDVLQGQMLRMENAIANLNITVARLQADKDLLSQQVSTQTKLITQLQAENSKPAFFAVVTGSSSIGNDQTLKFASVKTNQGGCYDPITGVFIAPSPGLYHFTCVTYNINNADDIHLQMNKNNDVLVNGYSSGSSEAESLVMNIVVNMTKGDHIYVQHRGTSGIDQVRGNLFSTFSGFKL
ncbi:unnamed protein product [Mytilus edulis]|uniref:C1q domain-containing protein n=1 Tax=Mytilus edulis TaxID=6550 RepID=A0A8S3VE13_MYTED|nr:unnamed protein product [Mytilus edulis]